MRGEISHGGKFSYLPGFLAPGGLITVRETSGSQTTVLRSLSLSPQAFSLEKPERNWLGASDVDLAKNQPRPKKKERRRKLPGQDKYGR